MKSSVVPEGGLRTTTEAEIGERIAALFNGNNLITEQNLENFPKYIRRQKVTRFLTLYELFKLCLPVKGSIIECGVNQGFGLMSWAHFSSVLEPNNLTRRIYGFDSFSGLNGITQRDHSKQYLPQKGDLAANSYDEILQLISIYDDNRFLGHVDKVHLVRGDVRETIPTFIENNKHTVVSLLYLDLDLYEPTKIALEYFVPRMPKGAVIAFDELDNPIWPGETGALLDVLGPNKLRLRRFDFDPYVAYAFID